MPCGSLGARVGRAAEGFGAMVVGFEETAAGNLEADEMVSVTSIGLTSLSEAEESSL